MNYMSMLNVNTTLIVWMSIFAVVIILISIYVGIVPVGIWLKCIFIGVHIPTQKLASMKLRRLDISLIVSNYINAKKAGVNITIDQFENLYLSGSDLKKITEAMITAHTAKIPLTIDVARRIELANQDVLNAVKNCIKPVLITTPNISGIAKDGIELIVNLRITAKINIAKLIGSAGEETLIAKTGENMVAIIGNLDDHKVLVSNPEIISKRLFNKKIVDGTYFEVMSIDLVEVEIGRDIGAKLQVERAEANKEIVKARAEERRTIAIATEQEMRAKTQEKKVLLLEKELQTPKNINKVIEDGKIGVMDYYRIHNLVTKKN